MKNSNKMFSDVNEMTNSKTWNKVRSSNETDLSYDQLDEVLEHINNSITPEEAEQDNFKLYEAIDSAIDAIANQSK